MKKALVVLLSILALMFAEYRIIMVNLRPYFAENNTFCIEFMGQEETYVLKK